MGQWNVPWRMDLRMLRTSTHVAVSRTLSIARSLFDLGFAQPTAVGTSQNTNHKPDKSA